jgi:hypothetical protein
VEATILARGRALGHLTRSVTSTAQNGPAPDTCRWLIFVGMLPSVRGVIGLRQADRMPRRAPRCGTRSGCPRIYSHISMADIGNGRARTEILPGCPFSSTGPTAGKPVPKNVVILFAGLLVRVRSEELRL